MKKVLLILLFVAAADSLNAQGFQDKRFSASYEIGPSFLGRFLIWDQFILLRNSLEIHYALSKRFTIGVGVNYARKNLPDSLSIISLTRKPNFEFDVEDLPLQNGVFTQALVSDLTISIRLRYYARKSGSIAPLGSYFGLSFDQGFQNSVTEYENTLGEIGFRYDKTNRTMLSLVTATFGRNIILKQKFLLGYGMTLGYNITRENQLRRYAARPFVNLGILF